MNISNSNEPQVLDLISYNFFAKSPNYDEQIVGLEVKETNYTNNSYYILDVSDNEECNKYSMGIYEYSIDGNSLIVDKNKNVIGVKVIPNSSNNSVNYKRIYYSLINDDIFKKYTFKKNYCILSGNNLTLFTKKAKKIGNDGINAVSLDPYVIAVNVDKIPIKNEIGLKLIDTNGNDVTLKLKYWNYENIINNSIFPVVNIPDQDRYNLYVTYNGYISKPIKINGGVEEPNNITEQRENPIKDDNNDKSNNDENNNSNNQIPVTPVNPKSNKVDCFISGPSSIKANSTESYTLTCSSDYDIKTDFLGTGDFKLDGLIPKLYVSVNEVKKINTGSTITKQWTIKLKTKKPIFSHKIKLVLDGNKVFNTENVGNSKVTSNNIKVNRYSIFKK